jgi:hypothetical protein
MLYEVKLSLAECDLLASLIGQPLHRVTTDGWAAELRTGTALLRVIPEEVATPDAEHPHGDVERPLVQAAAEPLPPEPAKVVGEGLGVVRAINVLSTLVGFSPVVDCPPEELVPGVVLPACKGYDRVYYPPERREEVVRKTGVAAVVDLDIGFELVADGCPSLVVYTRGFFVEASLQGLPAEEWVSFGAYMRRAVG